MPKAKKDKVVSLTKVKPKTRDHKEFIVEKVHLYIKKFSHVYVLTYENMTTNNFKMFKEQKPDSKFLMGKNRVIGVAFGTQEENSFKPNSFRVSELLKGHCSLYFTNDSVDITRKFFQSQQQSQFATGGTVAQRTIILYKGFDAFKDFSHSMEPHFRQLGLSTRLVNSKIELLSDYMLSEEGLPLTVEKCKILKHLDIKMSRLKFQIKAHYNVKTHKFQQFA